MAEQAPVEIENPLFDITQNIAAATGALAHTAKIWANSPSEETAEVLEAGKVYLATVVSAGFSEIESNDSEMDTATQADIIAGTLLTLAADRRERFSLLVPQTDFPTFSAEKHLEAHSLLREVIEDKIIEDGSGHDYAMEQFKTAFEEDILRLIQSVQTETTPRELLRIGRQAVEYSTALLECGIKGSGILLKPLVQKISSF